MRDPYQILGVAKSATADEIKSAYRKLAKKLHPDVNPGRKDIEQKFKEVTAAYDLLSDADKRARFDRGELDAQGNERGFGGGGGGDPFAGRGRRNHAGGDPFAGFGGSPDDIFEQFMRGARGGRSSGPARGEDLAYTLAIPFIEACLGGKRRVTLAGGKTLDVTIPVGVVDGHKLRLRGQGEAAFGGGIAGDAIVELKIEPHPYFTRKDYDIHLEAPISLPEAILGGSITVPTLHGSVALKINKGATTGTIMRLKGKGVPKGKDQNGDMFVKLKIMLPETIPTDLNDFMEKWAKKNAYDPRAKLGW